MDPQLIRWLAEKFTEVLLRATRMAGEPRPTFQREGDTFVYRTERYEITVSVKPAARPDAPSSSPGMGFGGDGRPFVRA